MRNVILTAKRNLRLSQARAACLVFATVLAIDAGAMGCAKILGEEGSTSPLLVSADDSLVISQVFAGGGEETAPYPDFVELFNRGTKPVDLTGRVLQLAAGDAPFAEPNALPPIVLSPGRHFLIEIAVAGRDAGADADADAEAGADADARADADAPVGEESTAKQPAPGTAPTLPKPDLTITSMLHTVSGKVMLVKASRVVECGGADASAGGGRVCAEWLDLVGYGEGVSQFEGKPVPSLSAATAAIRKNDRCRDTDDNSADFELGAPVPRNTLDEASVCPEEKGKKGDKGESGENGGLGEAGAKGATGETGAKGATGETGAKGSQGDAGLAGKDGKDGAEGRNGLNGKAGEEGADGTRGAAGAAGVGKEGSPGPRGANGAAGCQANGNRSGSGPRSALLALALALVARVRRRRPSI